MDRCKYANSRTQELSSLKELSVTSGNAAEIATKVLDITSNAQEVCAFVCLFVCGRCSVIVSYDEPTKQTLSTYPTLSCITAHSCSTDFVSLL